MFSFSESGHGISLLGVFGTHTKLFGVGTELTQGKTCPGGRLSSAWGWLAFYEGVTIMTTKLTSPQSARQYVLHFPLPVVSITFE